jgi:hypothetical protein
MALVLNHRGVRFPCCTEGHCSTPYTQFILMTGRSYEKLMNLFLICESCYLVASIIQNAIEVEKCPVKGCKGKIEILEIMGLDNDPDFAGNPDSLLLAN